MPTSEYDTLEKQYEKMTICKWEEIKGSYDHWNTSCKTRITQGADISLIIFKFFKFCPFCGKKLEAQDADK